MAVEYGVRLENDSIVVENARNSRDVYNAVASLHGLVHCGPKGTIVRAFGWWMTMDYMPADFSNDGAGCQVVSVRHDGMVLLDATGRERKVFPDEQLPSKVTIRHDPTNSQEWRRW